MSQPGIVKSLTTRVTSARAGDLFVGPATAPYLGIGTVAGTAQDAGEARTLFGKKGALVISVDDYGAAHNGTLDDRAAWVSAIAACVAGGVKTLRAPSATYAIGGAVIDLVGAYGLTIEGNGKWSTTIVALGSKSWFFGSSGACGNIVFRNIGFLGSATDDVTAPRRSRTFGTNTFQTAVRLDGDLVPSSSNGVISNIVFDNVRVEGCSSLPILLQGIRGEAKVTGSYFYNTMDCGWTYCESAICTNNESFKSADNGFSLSRGNKKVTATGNTVDLCAYYGIWVSGFYVVGAPTEIGPNNFTVSGNTVTNAGKGGIQANDAPKYGTITGNTVDTVYRGPTDAASDLAGVGIVIGGFPSTDQANPTDYADSILVSGNTLRSCARGGVLVRGAKNIAVRSNLIVDPGSQYLADGTTAILSSDTTTNFGIAVENPTTVTNLSIRANAIIDSRSTPYLNYGWFTTGSTNPDYSNNFVSSNARQTLSADNTNDSYAGTKTFSGNTKHSGGATAGSNSATGTVLEYDLNGAAGSTRPLRWLTAGVARWHLQANSTAESGSNAGSDLELNCRDDSGSLLQTVLRFTRSLGTLAFFRGVAWNRTSQSLAANGAVTFDAAAGNIHAVALSANATSSSINNAVTGQEITLIWIQDATGGRTYSWPSNCKFAGASAPSDTTAGRQTSVTFVYNGANWSEISRAVAVG